MRKEYLLKKHYQLSLNISTYTTVMFGTAIVSLVNVSSLLSRKVPIIVDCTNL